MASWASPDGWHAEQRLRFYAFQHPYVCTFVEQLQKGDIAGLLTLSNQRWHRDRSDYKDSTLPSMLTPKGPFFQYQYSPTDIVDKAYPRFNVDFDLPGAYAQYNWELFFHIPLFIATKLVQDQQYDEAMKWFHYIFNPTTNDPRPAPDRYWFFKPFRDLGQPEAIKEMMQRLANPQAKKDDIVDAIDEWREHPFEPHRIARRRAGAYEKTVLMKYLDMLIAWGDQLFSRDTIESINEATQLYVLAAKLLGERPVKVTGQPEPQPTTYYELRQHIDEFSNALVQMENVSGPWLLSFWGTGGKSSPVAAMGLYFCIPSNDKLLGYWDTVEDRLFKIRNCMNIEGVVRQLPLFEPPIDPALLVRARALGLDLASVLDDLSAPLPHYRFTFMLQKAREFCEELKQLGSLLLSALEKKDAEKLAQVRAGHEKALLTAVREVKKQQINEAENTLSSLEKAKELVDARKTHYTAVSARLETERGSADKQLEAQLKHHRSKDRAMYGALAALLPEFGSISGSLSGGTTVFAAGRMVAQGASLWSSQLAAEGTIASIAASASAYVGQLIRAQQDRDLQINLGTIESGQLDKQIAAADIRRQIAENELANHEKQIDQAGEIEDFLREKFTNQDLYTWMVTQVSAVYFQAYKLAYDMAKRAERTYRMELGLDASSFVQFGAWDNLHKGLLAGERLSLDVRRLEQAYLANNRREHEVTKHVSLALLKPGSLLELRETGTCEFFIPELLFDLDFPGHYYRRIKSVRLTIPCVTGPFGSVNAKLTLLNNRIRKSAKDKTAEDYPYKPNASNGDKRFLENLVGVQSIAASSAQNDAGLFELNFRDERFLPFEGAGVISRWRLELPPTAYRQFDYDTISDVIMVVSYTAHDGGDAFKGIVTKSIDDTVNKWLDELAKEKKGLPRLFSLRHEFPDAFYRLLNPPPDQTQHTEFDITIRHFPYFIFDRAKDLKLGDLAVYLKPRGKDPVDTTELIMTVKVNGNESTVKGDDPNKPPLWVNVYNSLKEGAFALAGNEPIGKWTIDVGSPGLNKDELEDILLLLTYTV